MDFRSNDLPCDGCQQFESAYLQLVKLVDTKLYDNDITQFLNRTS